MKAYLTIDDSPTQQTDVLADYLSERGLQGQFFCRGDRLAQDLEPAVRAVEKGMVLGNHNYSHTPAGALSYDDVIAEIEDTEKLIDAAYHKAGRLRPGKYFRFPYLDKGDGDRLEQRFGAIIEEAAAGRTLDLPGNEKVRRLQDYLKVQGFTQPYKDITHPLFKNPAIGGGADCMLTYTTGDWMLTARHKGKWDYKTREDLKARIDDDPWLCYEGGAQIVLVHDDPEIGLDVLALLDYMLDKGFTFLSV
ncbi:MAG: polysaccharide deacetylase family protein [Rhodospirillales bacterium]|nr:polysaccharide deacetylase family protein [Rhodospirillales bacterium]MCB9996773.1 polysaccharide deacetylase family protein [Rhodospirillales bacterium]